MDAIGKRLSALPAETPLAARSALEAQAVLLSKVQGAAGNEV
jgi:hypothetical protein